MSDCDKYLDLISAALDGALSPGEARELEDHLSQCPQCRALAMDLREIHAALSALPEEQPPAGLTDRIMDALPKDNIVPLPAKRAFQWKRWAASAAALALVLLGAWGMGRGAVTEDQMSPQAALFRDADLLSTAQGNGEDTPSSAETPTPQPSAALFKSATRIGSTAGTETPPPPDNGILSVGGEEEAAVPNSVGALTTAPEVVPNDTLGSDTADAPVESPAVSHVVSQAVATQAVAPVALPARQLPIYCVEQEEKRISISFDAAWGGENTAKLLEILEEYDVKATFFLIGDWVDTYPDKVKAIADAGHEVMNHSSHHDHLAGRSRGEVIADVEACNDKVEAITGVRPTLIRLPYGDYDNNALSAIRSLGMEPIQWDVDSLDWSGISANEIIERVTTKVKSGSIILCHNSAENTPEALPTILDTLLDEGYTFVPISELILPGEYCVDYTIDGVGKQHPAE